MASGKELNPRTVWAIQLALLVLLFAFFLGIVIWILHLIRISVELRDVPSASIGISIVAIPVLLLLLGVVNYVFWGMRAGREGK